MLPELYAFGPLTEGVTPRKDALACVRDGGAWTQLVPVDDGATPMAFRIFSFHFDPASDATGFVKRFAIALELDTRGEISRRHSCGCPRERDDGSRRDDREDDGEADEQQSAQRLQQRGSDLLLADGRERACRIC